MSTTQSNPAGTSFEVPVRNAEGNEVGRVQIDSSRIDQRVRPRLLKEAVLMYQATKRVGTHETKTRGQVVGSTIKPWRQKGTGRARAGTRKSPIWRGGGIVFGPHRRDYSIALPKKMRSRAVRSALLGKLKDGELVVVEGLKTEAPKTRFIAGVLKALGIQGRCLIGTAGMDRNLVLSARNLPGVRIAPVAEFNTLDILTSKTVLLTREALDEVLSGKKETGAGEGAPAQPAEGKEVKA